MTRKLESGLRVYDSAEQELAVTRVSPSSELLRFGKSEVSLSVTRALRGADALLLPKDGSPPVLGILLRGSDSFAEVPVRCEAGGQRCEAGAPARVLHRVGALLNVR